MARNRTTNEADNTFIGFIYIDNEDLNNPLIAMTELDSVEAIKEWACDEMDILLENIVRDDDLEYYNIKAEYIRDSKLYIEEHSFIRNV